MASIEGTDCQLLLRRENRLTPSIEDGLAVVQNPCFLPRDSRLSFKISQTKQKISNFSLHFFDTT